ncbi:hypothetical protein [Thalassospira lucentensis]|uniref:hypothetical protein n=1 Tax=Thalassospira lucentensis TaxID=168935 RepID=UPI002941C9ED|nr:hypothetical protein [Thalassospira lucentensis]WOI08936.1 hypothetical protein R1T41_00475 [Thalassospira lucentensis]
MKKLICALATLLPLSGCWWNDAPETYKGVATVTFDNGESFSHDFACDFRAQQATRHCDFVLSFKKKDWISVGVKSGRESEIISEDIKSYLPVYNHVKVGDGLRQRVAKDGRISVTIDAHAREEGRYMLLTAFDGWWLANTPATATREGSRQTYYVLENDGLSEGFTMGFKPRFSFYVENLKYSTKRGVWEYWDVQYDGPTSAKLDIRWEPVPANSLTS